MSNAAATDFVVHDFVHRRRAYSGLCGSCVRTFSISCVLSVGAYRSIPAAGTIENNWLGTQEKNSVARQGTRGTHPVLPPGWNPAGPRWCTSALRTRTQNRMYVSQWSEGTKGRGKLSQDRKAPPDRPVLKPYWRKFGVRNFGEDH